MLWLGGRGVEGGVAVLWGLRRERSGRWRCGQERGTGRKAATQGNGIDMGFKVLNTSIFRAY